ncbi:hypothetical protein ACOMHN_019427 [Nucella lapillus]
MADTTIARAPGSAGSGIISPTKSSRGGSRIDTPGSSGRSSIVKNDVRRWKRLHEQSAMLHLTELRSAKKVEVKTSKEMARKIARKIPIELLAKDWLSDSDASIEMRAYMVDKVMPTLILGVEKLLNAVDERGLADPEAKGGYDPNFNPLNFLAQYLFRNNPRFSNFSEASPYVHGLRQIAEELKAQLFDMEDNRLARIKAEAKRKREERELQARLRQQEKERRQQALTSQFTEWNVPTDNNRVELSLLQNALRSFMEVAEQFPPEIQEVAKFGHPLESTDETGRTLAINEFAQYLSLYVETLPSEVFEQFMVHMSKCANAHCASAERENRRINLTNLFIYCDHSGIGLLDRHRILSLFEQFWDVFEDNKKKLRNPRKWPVVEVDEADDTLSDEDETEDSVPTIPETAREDEEAQSLQQEQSERPTIQSGPEVTDTAGSGSGSGEGQGEGEEKGEKDGEEEEKEKGVVEEGEEGMGKGDVQDGAPVQAGEVEEGNATTQDTRKGEKDDGKDEKDEEKEDSGQTDETQERDGATETETETAEQDKVTSVAVVTSIAPAADSLMVITEEEEEEEEDEEEEEEEEEKSKKEAEKKEESQDKAETKGEAEKEEETKEDSEKQEETKEDSEKREETKEDSEKQAEEQEETKDESEKQDEAAGTSSNKPSEDEPQEEAREEKKDTASAGAQEQTDAESEQTATEQTEQPESEEKPGAQEQTDAESEQTATEQTEQPESEEKPGAQEQTAAESEQTATEQTEQPESEEKPEPTAAQEEKAEEGDRAAETTIQIEDTDKSPASGKDEGTAEKQAEQSEQKEKEKEETSADPELAQDMDITGEISKSGVQPRGPQPTPAATGCVSITFAQGTAFDREKTALTTNSGYRSQSQMSAFDESNLNVSQFVQLTETFLGELPDGGVFGKLVTYLRGGYEETEDEKMERLMKARKEAILANQKVQLDTLFEKWDNDGSGYLDLEEVEEVMGRYKEGQEKDTIAKAREDLKKQSKYQDSRLNKREFRTFVGLVIDALPGADAFEYFVEFLANSVERSYAERVRGEARKKWLLSIMTAAERSGVNLDPIYKSVFQALYRDAEAHGGEKRISANIAMLEKNSTFPHRGDVLLRYTACTPEDAEYVLNKALYKDMKGVSFSAVDQAKPIHVPRVNSHGNIYFWNNDRMPDEREGSFIVVPLVDRKRRVFGVLGVDTLADPHSKAIFITHEIQYFQGVAQTFATAYHLVDMRRKLLRITESAISWIKRRSPHVAEIMVYMVEPGNGDDFVLRRMMTTDSKGFPVHMEDPPVRLERKDNLFRDYLFKSVDNSETVTADAYGNRQLAFPLRNDKGKAIAVIDISTGTLKTLPAYESKEMQRMLRLLQQAHKEITREFAGEDKMQVLDAEKDDDTRMDILFDRLMLTELRDNVARLDAKAYAELRAYNSPPLNVLHILRATLALFHSDLAQQGEFDDWNKIKTYINNDLSQKVQAYDPTASDELISPSVIEEYLKDVPHGEVAKHGSLPAQHLYNWVFVCLSLIEHTRKMRQNQENESQ